ncbi:nuclear transport factor 2 family protein [Flavobacterium silvaticum]|uniref:Nuclear transport factor 2 family protein n=1 Tax=Flavobacterium silvaticum TaxID=1852020 RepID=A0A972FT98_9FLAO|nr:nuclear transport factor 2 family protein [Flavobacterium silvaticum]NMH27140.1 nuclear transport factor 2 family protein [Flavobacterium silvaticum]
MSTEPVAIAWMEAFNAKDIEALLSLYDDNAQHYSPKLKVREPQTNGLIIGKTAMRNWWQGAFDNMPTLFYKVISLTANENRVFMEYVRELEGDDDLLVAEVLEVENGKITASRVYHG